MVYLLLAALFATIAVVAFRAALRARSRQRGFDRRRARLGAPLDAAKLAEHEGKVVTLRGTLEGGELTTRFGPALVTIEDVHPDAISSRPEGLHLRSGDQRVDLHGATQVVLGEREESVDADGERAALRRISGGAEVVARGLVTRVQDGGYREEKPRFALEARAEGAWPHRPIAIAAIARDRRSLVVGLSLFGVASIVSVAVVVLAAFSERSSSGRPPPPPSTGASCRQKIGALLDRNDIFGAEAALATCNDPRARAETFWVLGRVDDAARAFADARRLEPRAPISLSEAEASLLADSRLESADLFRRMQKDWYRGPRDPSQRMLECLTEAPRAWNECMPNANFDLAGFPMSYGNPISAVTDTFDFALRLPLGRRAYDDELNARCERLGCRAAKPAALALFAAIAADTPRAAREFSVLDQLAVEYHRRGIAELTAGEYGGISNETLVAQDAFSVAAAAAWLAHDEPRVAQYLACSEAHAGSTMRDHLEMGKRAVSTLPPGDTSKWSSVEHDLFGLADHEEPAAFFRRLSDLRYGQPFRLHALLAGRPRLHAAGRAWVEGEFLPLCRTCGIWSALEVTAKRREAARVVGAKDLEAKLAEVTRRFGEAWARDASRKTLWTMELHYRPD